MTRITRIRLLGRRVQPVVVALAFAATASGIGRINANRDPLNYGIGWFALALVAAFTIAWFARRQDWTRRALLVSAILWIFISGSGWMALGSVVSSLNALAFATLSIGAWWLEARDPRDAA